jgi:hypothetical protein
MLKHFGMSTVIVSFILVYLRDDCLGPCCMDLLVNLCCLLKMSFTQFICFIASKSISKMVNLVSAEQVQLGPSPKSAIAGQLYHLGKNPYTNYS